MASHHLRNLLLKISTGLGLCFTTFVVVPETVNAAVCGDNPSSLSSECYSTPERYVIKVYEMGLCSSDPLSSSDFDGTTCNATLTSADGIEVDIAGTTASLDGGTSTRPANGTYEYAYIKMANTFGLRGSYELNSTTYYSTSSGGADTSGTAANYTENLYNFAGGSSCSGTPEYTASETLTGGVMKARLADTSYVTSTSCGASERLVGTFKPNTAITIEASSTGLQVEMTTTNSGMTVIPVSSGSNAGIVVDGFGGGPFQPVFEVY